MKTLKDILIAIPTINIVGNVDMPVANLQIDSRKVAAGDVFFAQKGTLVDGHDYINQVISKGASVVFCEVLPTDMNAAVTYVQVADVSAIVGLVAANYYDHPSRDMKVVGVTGTNGKTTIATLLYQTYMALGYYSGLISTVANHIGHTIIPSTHTTPDPVSLQALFAQMRDSGCDYVFMEVSSHSVVQHRIAGVDFNGAIFTNITRDHLDYHKTFDAYIKAKKQFFDGLSKTAFAITNIDDKRGAVMLQNTKATTYTYAVKTPADFKAKVLENDIEGLLLLIDEQEVFLRMHGLFNAYNVLAVYAAATLLGADKMEVLEALSKVQGAPGRFQTVRSPKEQMLGIVDYAHTPDALLNVLTTVMQFKENKQVITVVGCGGDRDQGKRPLMAGVAVEYSDKVILTADNPRSENPEMILDEMEAGIPITQKRKVLRITDRRAAIQTAVNLAQPGDIILIAGKGHENYQEINGVKHHFDDIEEITNTFKQFDK